MRKATYIGVFEPHEDGAYSVYFPDLLGCTSYGDTLEKAKESAKEGLGGHFCLMERDGDEIPEPSENPEIFPETEEGYLTFPVTIFPDLVHNEWENKRVRTNVTIPNWLKQRAEGKDINLSRLLETALMEVLEIPRQSQQD